MLTASPNTYCDPVKLAINLAKLDRFNAEQVAWDRAPEYLRKRGYQQGVDALLVYRKGEMVPVVLSELTDPELDRLLTVPAFVAGGM